MIFQKLHELEKEGAIMFDISSSSSCCIDRYGIREANRRAMGRSIRKILRAHNQCTVLIDGRDNFRFYGVPQETIEYVVRGDSIHLPIMMASVLAKVYRDHHMIKTAKKYPLY